MTLTVGHEKLVGLERISWEGNLALLYQPEVHLRSGAIVAMEALLRWHHAELGVLAPPAFLELAERSGQLADIDEWVLRTGAAEAAAWSALPGPARTLWLNVSPTQLSSAGLPDLVASVLAAHGLPDGTLGLEVSEENVQALGQQAAPLLGRLREAGAAIAVDDFSSWYCALGAIDELPVTAVKLGHQYVRDIDVSDRAPAVRMIVERAHDNGMHVVAEGVESWGEAARLTELGCDRAHGWLFSSPQRADKARWLLQQQGSGWQGGVLRPQEQARSVVPSPRAAH